MCCAFHAVCWIVGLFVWSFVSCCIYRLFLRSSYDNGLDTFFHLLASHIASIILVLLAPFMLLIYPAYRLSGVVDKYEISFKKKD